MKKKQINKEFLLKNINTVIIIAYLVSLLLPFCTILSMQAGYGNNFNISGFDALLGCTFTDGSKVSGGIWGILMVILPILLIVVNYVGALKKLKKPALLVCSLGSLVAQNIAENTVANTLNVDATRGIGYYISLIALIVLTVVCIMQFRNVPISKEGFKQLKDEAKEKVSTK